MHIVMSTKKGPAPLCQLSISYVTIFPGNVERIYCNVTLWDMVQCALYSYACTCICLYNVILEIKENKFLRTSGQHFLYMCKRMVIFNSLVKFPFSSTIASLVFSICCIQNPWVEANSCEAWMLGYAMD